MEKQGDRGSRREWKTLATGGGGGKEADVLGGKERRDAEGSPWKSRVILGVGIALRWGSREL